MIPDDRSAPGGERRQRKVKNGQKAVILESIAQKVKKASVNQFQCHFFLLGLKVGYLGGIGLILDF